MPQHDSHAALREHSRRRALLLPTVLLLAGATSFAGLAVLPAAADVSPTRASPTPSAVASGSGSGSGILPRATRDRPPAPPAPAPAPPAPPPPATALPAPPPPAAAPPKPAAPEFVRPGVGRLTSSFGQRWGRLHAGLDLAAGVGAPVTAVTKGTVLSAGNEGGYGHVVRLQHADATVTVYAHLSEILVTVGQQVGTGHVVAREGNSGRSTGPHLHFEVRVDDVPVDPAAWLRARGVAL